MALTDFLAASDITAAVNACKGEGTGLQCVFEWNYYIEMFHCI